MSRPSKAAIKIAPFNLRETGPLTTQAAYEKCGFKWYRAATTAAPDPKATIDPDTCPHCHALVEWAVTVKYGAMKSDGKPEQIRYVYARCQSNPAQHRWGFKKTDPEKKQNTQPPTPKDTDPMPTTTCKHCNYTTTDAPSYRRHMMDAHGIDWIAPSGSMQGSGTPLPPETEPTDLETTDETRDATSGEAEASGDSDAKGEKNEQKGEKSDVEKAMEAVESALKGEKAKREAEKREQDGKGKSDSNAPDPHAWLRDTNAVKELVAKDKEQGEVLSELVKHAAVSTKGLLDLAVKVKNLKPGNATIDEATIKRLIAENGGSGKTEIKIPTIPTAEFKGEAHARLKEVLRYIAAGERFFLFVGPAATGKSTLASQIAETLKIPLGALAVTETMMREDILGAKIHNITNGTARYEPTPFVEAWSKDGVCLLDEVDRGNPNTLTALNSIEQSALYVPRTDAEGGALIKSSKALVICTANTYGTGGNRTYVGANQLDAAFVDRFRVIEVGYDRKLEETVCGGDSMAKEAVTYFTEARKRAEKASVRRPMTTRMIRRAVTDMRLSNGTLTPSKAFRQTQCGGWAETEINSVFPL